MYGKIILCELYLQLQPLFSLNYIVHQSDSKAKVALLQNVLPLVTLPVKKIGHVLVQQIRFLIIFTIHVYLRFINIVLRIVGSFLHEDRGKNTPSVQTELQQSLWSISFLL